MKNINSGIYSITNIVVNKFYIGSAVDIRCRFNQHKSELRRNIHSNERLQNAWNKYGESAFRFRVLEIVEDKVRLLFREQLWLNYFLSFDRYKGYNLNSIAGSNLGMKWSDETKKKMSLVRKGVPKSIETRAKMSAWQIGRKLSKLHSENISLAKKGTIVSEETKKKMRGKKRTAEHKAILLKNVRNVNKWPCENGHKCKCVKCKATRKIDNSARYFKAKLVPVDHDPFGAKP